MKYFLVFIFILSSYRLASQATNPPFWKEVQDFKKLDSISKPALNQILFIGSSSFAMWKNIESYFPGYNILNRSFGGSTLLDQLFYFKSIVLPYHPKQIFIYCGENDLAVSNNINADSVYNRFIRLFYLIKQAYPNVNIAFVSLKPSPLRATLFEKQKASNKLIQHFLQKQKNTHFINIVDSMLVNNQCCKTEIFTSDSLHINKKGYEIWAKIIAPYLQK